jgi:hypothetical protein
MSNAEEHTSAFIQLIVTLTHSAWIALGKLVNPATQKTEIHLESAQATIDLLEMLQAKTRGNLDAEEERFLKSTLAGLQLNYVEVAAAAPAERPAPPAAEPAAAPPAERSAPTAGDEKDSKVRFHKSFG